MGRMRSRVVAAAFAVVLSLAAGPAPAGEDALTPEQKKSVERIVRDYILKNPEIITEAIAILRERQRVEQERAQAAALVAHRAQIFDHPMTPVSGNPEGDVTIVEFFDYQCPFCKRSLPVVKRLMESDPGLRFVWKEFPILGPVSRFAARAAMAAHKQGKYFEFHLAVMGARGRLTEERVLKLAAKAGLDVARLEKDMADPSIDAYLDETIMLAEALGIGGTPAFIIGGRLVPGALSEEEMRRYVAAARAGDRPAAPGN